MGEPKSTVFVRDDGSIINLHEPATMAEKDCDDCQGRGVMRYLMHRKGDTVFVCAECFKASGKLESKTIGILQPRPCSSCGVLVTPDEPYMFITADEDFSIDRMCHCVISFLKKPGNGHLAFAFLKMQGQVR